MRLDKAVGISVCFLLATQLDCSSSNNGRKTDGAPGDGPASYKDQSGPDSSDGSSDLGRDASTDPAATGFEVGPDTAVDISSTADVEIRKDTAMPDVPLDVPTGGDVPALPIDTGIDRLAVDQMPLSSLDGGDGPDASGESRPNPCASCTPNQVCVQLNDGVCSKTTGLSVGCRTVSDACRTKLVNSGGKSCYSLSECESELCPQPSYKCVYASPCGNEVPEAALYCYGA
jgi:hypothetical protein